MSARAVERRAEPVRLGSRLRARLRLGRRVLGRGGARGAPPGPGRRRMRTHRRGAPLRRRPAAVFAALALCGGAALAAAPPAAAGTFRISQCAAWDGARWSPRSTQSALWSVSGGFLVSSCGEPGGTLRLGSANWRLAQNDEAAFSLTLPPAAAHTSIAGLWLDWTAVAQEPSVDPAFLTLFGDGTWLAQIHPGMQTNPGTADRVTAPDGTRSLRFSLWCSPVNGPGFCSWSGAEVLLHGMTLDLRDDADPAVHATGSLLDGTPQHGRTTLAFDAADPDSGVRHVEAWLSGVRIADVDLGASCADDRLPACPASVSRTVEVDTTAVPDGGGRLRLHAVDAAGNATDVDAGHVEVANPVTAPPTGGGGPAGGGAPGPAPAPAPAPGPGAGEPHPPRADSFPPNPLAGRGHLANGTGAADGARLIAHLAGGGHRGARIVVRAGTRVAVRGRLSGPSGDPIGRAVLTVVTRRPGRRPQVAGLLRTRADGHFAGPLPGGPSRAVSLAYHGFGDSPAASWSRALRLTVRARVALTAVLAGGGPRPRVWLRGRVSRPIPRRGVLVTVERRVAGTWVVAGHARSDERGRFGCPAPSGGGRIRVTVPAQEGFAYASGHSRVIRLE